MHTTSDLERRLLPLPLSLPLPRGGDRLPERDLRLLLLSRLRLLLRSRTPLLKSNDNFEVLSFHNIYSITKHLNEANSVLIVRKEPTNLHYTGRSKQILHTSPDIFFLATKLKLYIGGQWVELLISRARALHLCIKSIARARGTWRQ